jgi:hypothetical protein
MTSARVPAFDLLPATLRRRFGWRRHRATLALAFLGGVAIAWFPLADRREQLERAALELARQQGELERLQAERVKLEQVLQASQREQAQRLLHEQQQAQWGLAAQTLRAVAQPLGSVPGSQLLELRLDEQGLQLVGQIEPQRMQAWLEAVRQRSRAWDPPELIEIAPPGRSALAAGEPPDLLRFVARFGRAEKAAEKAAVGGTQP